MSTKKIINHKQTRTALTNRYWWACLTSAEKYFGINKDYMHCSLMAVLHFYGYFGDCGWWSSREMLDKDMRMLADDIYCNYLYKYEVDEELKALYGETRPTNDTMGTSSY